MKTYMDRHQFYTFKELLLKSLKPIKNDFNFILGIENGGRLLSEYLALHLNKPHHTIRISFYDKDDQRLFFPVIKGKDKIDSLKRKTLGKFLWVDDIIDSGSTLQWFINETGLQKGIDFSVVTLHWCEENSPNLKPEFFIEKKKKSEWICYPWEKNESAV